MIITREIKIRWLRLLAFFRCPFLATRAIGHSQQLRIIRGADIVSEAKIEDNLCQEEVQWLAKTTRDSKDSAALWAIALGQILFFGTKKLVMAIPVVNSMRVIIIIQGLFCSL